MGLAERGETASKHWLKPTPILAFMQNMWLKDPRVFWDRYNRYAMTDGDERAEFYRLEFIKRALFHRCITGKRIMAAFGEKLVDQIVWEESTRKVADNPRTVFPADMKHMAKALDTHKPKIVVTFGTVAGHAMIAVWHGESVRCVHPAARGSHIISELSQTARRLKDYIE